MFRLYQANAQYSLAFRQNNKEISILNFYASTNYFTLSRHKGRLVVFIVGQVRPQLSGVTVGIRAHSPVRFVAGWARNREAAHSELVVVGFDYVRECRWLFCHLTTP